MAYLPVYTPPKLPAYMTDPSKLPSRTGLPAGSAFPAQFLPQETVLNQQLGALPAIFAPQHAANRSRLTQQLAGLGGWRIDPNTGQVDYNADAPLGERQLQAVHGVRNAANARGMLYSSLTDEGTGAALGQLQRQAQSDVGDFQTAEFNTLGSEGGQFNALAQSLGGLYGDAAAFLQDPANIPPPPDPVLMAPGTVRLPGQPAIQSGLQQGIVKPPASRLIGGRARF